MVTCTWHLKFKLHIIIMALEAHGFYGRSRVKSRQPQLPSDVVERVDKLTEKAQQYNAVAIQSVAERVEDIVKSRALMS